MSKLGQDHRATRSLFHHTKMLKKDPPCEFMRGEEKHLTIYQGVLSDNCPQSADHPLVDACQQSAYVVIAADELECYRAPLVARKCTNEEEEDDISHTTEQLIFRRDQIPIGLGHSYGECGNGRIGITASIDNAGTVSTSPSPQGSTSSSLPQSASSSPPQATLHPIEQIKSVTVRVGDVFTTL